MVSFMENLLQVVGAIVGLSVASVAYKGYRETRSPTLLRLAVAFSLLGTGFIITAATGFSGIGALPNMALLISLSLLIAGGLQTLGYFFLAFSHFVKFRAFRRLGVVVPFIGPVTLAAVFNVLSLYFLLYGGLETAMSYFKIKKIQTLLVAMGLTMIAVGEFTRWIALFPDNSVFGLVSLVLRIAGVSVFLVPVLKFTIKGRSGKK